MEVFRDIDKIREYVRRKKSEGIRVGFVPTMGYLHPGHISLVKKAREECGVVVASIFVNPMQFGPREDFSEYPRDFGRDSRMLAEAGVDAVFYPDKKEMYPDGFCTYIDFTGLTGCLCGRSRPVFFRGVATVVVKLFNIVGPDEAYFGQKDYQQFLVVRRMTDDLNIPVAITAVPTMREPDGLAMSSRNVYLGPEERASAPVLYRALMAAAGAVAQGERRSESIAGMVREMLLKEPLLSIDYCEVRSLPCLEEASEITTPALLALAVRYGKTRLIDNIVLEG